MKKVIAIVFSFVLVISNISLTYATHFCEGKEIESQLMIGAQDLTCGMIMPESTCDNANSDCTDPHQSEIDTNCCDNQYIQLSIDDNYNTVSMIELPNMEIVVAFIYTFFSPIVVSNNISNAFFLEAPPLVRPNVQALFQVYLI